MLIARSLQLLRSLQWRLVCIFVLLAITLMISTSISINYFIENSYYDTFKKRIEKGFNDWQISEMPSSNELLRDLRDDRNAIYLFLITSFKSYTIFDIASNAIIYSSDKLFMQDKNRLTDEIQKSDNFISALAGKIGDKGKLLYFKDKVFFDYARRKGNFIIYFRYDREEWIGTIREFNRIIRMSFLIAIFASLIFGYLLSKTITIPIENLMRKAKKMAAGEFGEVLQVKSDDEIGKLTEAFNFMSKELKTTLSEISKEKNKIETILNYMTDGVVAFNLQGELIHSNPASRQILNVYYIEESFNRFSEKYNLELSIEEILNLDFQQTKEKQICFNNKYIRVYFAVFTDTAKKAEGIIVVFQDITEQQKLENMRKEFVANVSHELRTPLTSIKSYTETLLDETWEDSETAKRFLNVINSEADRMTRLVKDLLQLSRLDNNQMQWCMQESSFVNLVKHCVEKIKFHVTSKDQKLDISILNEVPQIIIDPDRIEQVVLNILSNAIKYTPQYGKIQLVIGYSDSYVYLKVIDNGIGIPQMDIPRIFERFYRVDKARSRDMGGTGLGLSIAKEIIEAHNGKIEIKSEVNVGTEVMMSIPV